MPPVLRGLAALRFFATTWSSIARVFLEHVLLLRNRERYGASVSGQYLGESHAARPAEAGCSETGAGIYVDKLYKDSPWADRINAYAGFGSSSVPAVKIQSGPKLN